MKRPGKNILLIILYIITAALLAAALGLAVGIGYKTGIRGIYNAALPKVTGGIARHPRLVLTAMLLLLFLFLMSVGSWLERAERKQCIAAGICMTAILLALQMCFVFRLNIIQNTDSFEVQDQAMAIARGVLKSVDYEQSAYFRKYGNNDLYLIACIGIFRFCDFFHIENWAKVFALFNTFCIDAGIFMACRIMALVKNPRTALRAYLMCVLNPLNYLFIHWTYTCTFSIPLMLLGIYLALHIRRHPERAVRNAVLSFLIGIDTVVGYYLRPTSVFPMLALIVCLIAKHIPGWFRKIKTFFRHGVHSQKVTKVRDKTVKNPAFVHETAGTDGAVCGPPSGSIRENPASIHRTDEIDGAVCGTSPGSIRENSASVHGAVGKLPHDARASASGQNRHSGRQLAYQAVTLFLTISIMAGTAALIRRTAARYDTDNRYNFPIAHWLMVGMTGTGQLTGEDLKYTASFETKEEKKAADLAALKEGIESRDLPETIRFYLMKIGLTWSDGTGAYYNRTTQSDNSDILIYQLVSGSRRTGLMLYCHAFRILLLFFAIAGIIREISRGAKSFAFAVFAVTILGGLVFYLFWEGKPVYSLPFTPFLALLACDAWNPMNRAYFRIMKENAIARRAEKAFTAGILAIAIIVPGLDSRDILRNRDDTVWSIVCSSPAIKKNISLETGENMVQEFSPRYAFNRIRISVKKREEAEGGFRITLRQGEDVLDSFTVRRSDVHNGKITLGFDTIRPKSGDVYTLAIENQEDGKPSIDWRVRNSYILSQYKGTRYIDDQPEAGDLLMDVYEETAFP